MILSMITFSRFNFFLQLIPRRDKVHQKVQQQQVQEKSEEHFLGNFPPKLNLSLYKKRFFAEFVVGGSLSSRCN